MITTKRLFCMVLMLCILICQIALQPFSVGATEIIASGSCGDTATWTLDNEGLLTVSGTGDIMNFSNPEEPNYNTGIAGDKRIYVDTLVISDGITSIGDYAFSRALFLSDVTIPSSVTRIGKGAFEYCDLKTVSFVDGNSITEIDDAAFMGNRMLRAVDLSNCAKLEKVGAEAFSYNQYLTEIILPENGALTDIGDAAFSKNGSLVSVEIPATVTSMGDGVFAECTSLLRVMIPSSVTNIGKDVFRSCSSPTVYGQAGSAAEQCAKDNSIKFISGGFDQTVVVFQGICGDNLTWTLDSAGTLRISGTGDMTDFASISYTPWQARNSSIKAVVVEDGVTRIGKDAFNGIDALESVVMADTVTSMGENVFMGARNLKSVVLSKNLTSISNNAFYCCYGLTEIYIPASVTSIGEYSFYAPEGMTRFVVDENNAYFSNDERGVLYNKDKTVIIQYPLGNTATSYTIPASVQRLADIAFHQAENLTEISFADGSAITEIGEGAFRSCYSLTSVVLPDSVVKIGGSAFSGCKSLESIKLPSSLQTIDSSAFRHCPLKSIDLPETVTFIGDSAFYSTDLVTVNIPGSVTSIGDMAFRECNELESVNISASVTSIGSEVFDYCEKLAKITVDPANPAYTSDEHGVLFNKDKTVLIKYPRASADTAYIIPQSVTMITAMAFEDASALESITLPSNLSVIGNYAFARTSITEVSIPATVGSMGVGAFSGCVKLAKIDIPANSILTTIERDAFRSTLISEFDIPASVTYLGIYAFGLCDNLSRVSLIAGSNLKAISSGVFVGTPNVTFHVPEGSEAEEAAKKAGIKYTYVNEIKVLIDGERVAFDQHPVIMNDRTLVPMRAIFEALGAEVEWEHDTMTAIGEKDGVSVRIQIGAESLVKNGEAVVLDCPAVLVNNRTLVPVRAVSESLGCSVEWNADTRTVVITTSE